MHRPVLQFVDNDENYYEHYEGSYIGQTNKHGQRHGYGIWTIKHNREIEKIKTIFGEWEYDDLLNG